MHTSLSFLEQKVVIDYKSYVSIHTPIHHKSLMNLHSINLKKLHLVAFLVLSCVEMIVKHDIKMLV
jgi:hypothetical protein